VGLSKKGGFKVKSYFSSLVGSEGRRFPWKSVWQTQAHSRAVFFAWAAALGKILIVDNLRKRKIIIVDRCYLCKRDGESVDYLLLYYDVASTLWHHVFSRFGMSWVMCLLVEAWKAKECCGLEDSAYLHPLVCLEREKS